MKINKFKVEFVDKIPHLINEGIIYVCINCNVIVHNCACGCGERTVTPINKERGWLMIYDGQTITLKPSIGNYSIPCNSHYYIVENKVEWLNTNYRKNHKKSLFGLFKRVFNNKMHTII